MQTRDEVLKPHAVGFQTIPNASIKCSNYGNYVHTLHLHDACAHNPTFFYAWSAQVKLPNLMAKVQQLGLPNLDFVVSAPQPSPAQEM